MISSYINHSYDLPQLGFEWRRRIQLRVSTHTPGTTIPSRASRSVVYVGKNGFSSLTTKHKNIKESHVGRIGSSIPSEYCDLKEVTDGYFGLREMISGFWPTVNIVYRFCRPYALLFTGSATISTSLRPIISISDLSPTYLLAMLQATLAMMLAIVFVNGINALADIAIDKINMPNHAPIASEELSFQAGLTMTILSAAMSITIGAMSRSPALLCAILTTILVGGVAYSIDLPFLRWKRNPVMAAATCLIMSIAGNIPIVIHFQNYVLKRPIVYTKSLTFSSAFFAIFMVITSFLKDIPDVDGDRANGIKTLAVRIGKEKVFSIVFYTMLILFGASSVFGIFLKSNFNKIIMVFGNIICVYLLFDGGRQVDFSKNDSVNHFRLLTWKLAFMENILIPFVR